MKLLLHQKRWNADSTGSGISDIQTSRSVDNFVNDLCVKLCHWSRREGAVQEVRRRCAIATSSGSASRAVQNGAPNIERTDKLAHLIAGQKNLNPTLIDQIVTLVDSRLETNRKQEVQGTS